MLNVKELEFSKVLNMDNGVGRLRRLYLHNFLSFAYVIPSKCFSKHELLSECIYCCHSYVLKLEKADVYRLPYLSSSGPGFGSSFTSFLIFHNSNKS